MVALHPTLVLNALSQGAGASFNRPFVQTAAAALTLPEGWSYQNCYQNSESGRALSVMLYTGSANSLSSCVAKCDNAGFAYAGAASGQECWCGDALLRAELDVCMEPCSGDSSQTCGDNNRISVFSKWSISSPAVAVAPSQRSKRTTFGQRRHASVLKKRALAHQSYGCYVDANARALPLKLTSSASMTTATCQSVCASQTPSLPYFGTENGDECWCGSALPSSSLAASPTDCSTACAGDPSGKCGGAWRINVYGPPAAWTSLGCFVDQSARTLAGPTYTDPAMTPSLCQQKCSSSGYAYAGTEYQTQCFCGNAMTGSTASTACTLPCGGDPTKTCGGSWALNVYTLSTAASPWTSLGCYADQPARTLAAATFTDPAMTPALCQQKCAGYAYAGVEYGTQCFCAAEMSGGSAAAATSAGCTSRCGGDASQICGGGWAVNVYHLAGAASAVPTTATSSIVMTTTTATSSAAASTPTGGSTATTQSTSGSWWTANGSNTGKTVTAHFIVGNAYGRTSTDWTNDIKLAAAQGIDAFALNMGTDSWQIDRMQDAYDAASALSSSSQGISFKMFVSFDMTSFDCGSSTAAIVSTMRRFASHPAQLRTAAGEMWVSTFDGGSCEMWQATLDSVGVSYCFIPAFFNDISGASLKSQQPAIGGDFFWGGGWPSGDTAILWDNDNYRIARNGIDRGAGDIYMTSVSPLFFVHLNAGRNSVFKFDDWLYVERWEMLHDQRSLVDAVEVISWNDWGESHYISAVDLDTSDIPSGATYATPQFDHTAFLNMAGYYVSYFKTGNRPTVTADRIFMWSRTHAAGLSIGSDPIGPVQNADWVSDTLFIVLFATSGGTLTVNQGGTSWSEPVVAGPNKLSHDLVSTSSVIAELTRNGQTVFTFTAPLTYGQGSPSEYNFNAISASGP